MYIRVYTSIVDMCEKEVTDMNTNLVKWGNSGAIRLPKKILEELHINETNFGNISFDIIIDGDTLLLRKKQKKTKFELMAEKSKGEKINPKTDIEWGSPIGKEVW